MKLRAGFSIQQQQDLHHAEQKMTVMSIMDKQWLAFVQFTFRPLFQYRYPADLFMNTRMRISKLATYSVAVLSLQTAPSCLFTSLIFLPLKRPRQTWLQNSHFYPLNAGVSNPWSGDRCRSLGHFVLGRSGTQWKKCTLNFTNLLLSKRMQLYHNKNVGDLWLCVPWAVMEITELKQTVLLTALFFQ